MMAPSTSFHFFPRPSCTFNWRLILSMTFENALQPFQALTCSFKLLCNSPQTSTPFPSNFFAIGNWDWEEITFLNCHLSVDDSDPSRKDSRPSLDNTGPFPGICGSYWLLALRTCAVRLHLAYGPLLPSFNQYAQGASCFA